MASERWAEVERIYHAALEHEPDARAAFVGQACGDDDALRREVQSLLGFDRAAETFLERPALEVEAKSLLGDRAPLLAGRDLDEYRILALLGRGGMGDVYRARDTRLGRDVALKVLPEAFLADAERIARFEREAKAIASFNHPNSAAIHGLEESQGICGAGAGARRGADARRSDRRRTDAARRSACDRETDRAGARRRS